MANRNVIPLEIQDVIIDCVAQQYVHTFRKEAREALRCCSLVCRHWRIRALRWLLSRINFTIEFGELNFHQSGKPSTLECVNERAESFLRFIDKNPTILGHIEAVFLNVVWRLNTPVSLGSEYQATMLIGRICTLLQPTIREVAFSFSSPNLIIELGMVRRMLATLYCGPRVHTICVHNTLVPRLVITRGATIRRLVLIECAGLLYSTLDDNFLPCNIPPGVALPPKLDIINSRRTRIFADLWAFVTRFTIQREFFARIKSLIISLSHTIPEHGMWDMDLFTNRLRNLQLLYKETTGELSFSPFRHLQNVDLPFVCSRLKRLSMPRQEISAGSLGLPEQPRTPQCLYRILQADEPPCGWAHRQFLKSHRAKSSDPILRLPVASALDSYRRLQLPEHLLRHSCADRRCR